MSEPTMKTFPLFATPEEGVPVTMKAFDLMSWGIITGRQFGKMCEPEINALWKKYADRLFPYEENGLDPYLNGESIQPNFEDRMGRGSKIEFKFDDEDRWKFEESQREIEIDEYKISSGHQFCKVEPRTFYDYSGRCAECYTMNEWVMDPDASYLTRKEDSDCCEHVQGVVYDEKAEAYRLVYADEEGVIPDAD